MIPLRLAFMGSPDFSVPVLDALIDAGHEIVCVYAQPPRPAGRGQKLRRCPVHTRADELGIDVRTPESLKNEATMSAFVALDIDAAIVVAYGLILPETALQGPRLGCINVHASLLPRWRGAAPIQRAIEAGDTQSGVCIMAMEAGLDSGPVYARRTMVVADDTTGGSLHDALSIMGAALMAESLPAIANGSLKPVEQSADGITYADKIGPRDGDIDWGCTALAIERMIRAFNPWPTAAFMNGDERIKVFSAEVTGYEGGTAPGTVLDRLIDGCPVVACGEGALVLRELQRPGKGRQPAYAFLRGYSLPSDTLLT